MYPNTLLQHSPRQTKADVHSLDAAQPAGSRSRAVSRGGPESAILPPRAPPPGVSGAGQPLEAVPASVGISGTTSGESHAAVALTHLANAAASAKLSSPTQASFNHHPPLPPTLQPSFHPAQPAQPAPASPPNGLPSLTGLFARDTPTKYYDPTQDAGDRSITPRQASRFHPSAAEVSLLPTTPVCSILPKILTTTSAT